VAVHIGKELRVRLKASGLPVTTLAKRIGCSPKTVHALFKRPSIDTMLLKKCCEVLDFDFFSLFSIDMQHKAAKSSIVSEPAAAYGKRPDNDDVEIVIRSKGGNTELLQRMLKAMEEEKK
jgi:DNA-binding Xre family transcriptional regulator